MQTIYKKFTANHPVLSSPWHSIVLKLIICYLYFRTLSLVIASPYFWERSNMLKITELITNLAWCTLAQPQLFILLGQPTQNFCLNYMSTVTVKYQLDKCMRSFLCKMNFYQVCPIWPSIMYYDIFDLGYWKCQIKF